MQASLSVESDAPSLSERERALAGIKRGVQGRSPTKLLKPKFMAPLVHNKPLPDPPGTPAGSPPDPQRVHPEGTLAYPAPLSNKRERGAGGREGIKREFRGIKLAGFI